VSKGNREGQESSVLKRPKSKNTLHYPPRESTESKICIASDSHIHVECKGLSDESEGDKSFYSQVRNEQRTSKTGFFSFFLWFSKPNKSLRVAITVLPNKFPISVCSAVALITF